MSATVPVLDSLLVEYMSEAVIYADGDGLIRRWNPGAEALLGYTAAEAVGQSLDLIIPERLREPHWRGFDAALARGAAAHGRESRVTKALHKDGEARYVDMSFAVVLDDGGRAIGSVAVASDATRRYRDEQALRRRLAELEAAAGGH